MQSEKLMYLFTLSFYLLFLYGAVFEAAALVGVDAVDADYL